MKGKVSGTAMVAVVVVAALGLFYFGGGFKGNTGQTYQVQSPIVINQPGQSSGECNLPSAPRRL